jgi:hypothetical protein
VAQLGARFHGMEEVIGSIPIRSTNFPLQIQIRAGSDFLRVTETAPALVPRPAPTGMALCISGADLESIDPFKIVDAEEVR